MSRRDWIGAVVALFVGFAAGSLSVTESADCPAADALETELERRQKRGE